MNHQLLSPSKETKKIAYTHGSLSWAQECVWNRGQDKSRGIMKTGIRDQKWKEEEGHAELMQRG